MATLIVDKDTDFSGETLSDIDKIVFTILIASDSGERH